jgi:hypothetical protein
MNCPTGYECWCCVNGVFQKCPQYAVCDPGTQCCLLIGSDLRINCGSYEGQECACQGGTTYPLDLLGMVGDDSTMKLRRAMPEHGETPEIYGPQNWENQKRFHRVHKK